MQSYLMMKMSVISQPAVSSVGLWLPCVLLSQQPQIPGTTPQPWSLLKCKDSLGTAGHTAVCGQVTQRGQDRSLRSSLCFQDERGSQKGSLTFHQELSFHVLLSPPFFFPEKGHILCYVKSLWKLVRKSAGISNL